MQIGEASELTGVSAKMIRHYESIDLLAKANRTASGYRSYTEADLHTLRFIRHARDVGFSLAQIGELLNLWQDRRRRSSEVRKLALGHIQQLEAKIAESQAMKATLEHLVHCCHGDERPDCPILDGLAAVSPRHRPMPAQGRSASGRPRGGSVKRPT